jgi:hypothetical protein
MEITYNDPLEVENLLKNVPVTASRLKKLTIGLGDLPISSKYPTEHTVDRIFNCNFQSCPNLESFCVQGKIYAQPNTSLNFSFIGHERLKVVQISLEGCRYYAFDGEVAKWTCFSANKRIKYDDSISDAGEPFHLNLLYSRGKTKLSLSYCL